MRRVKSLKIILDLVKDELLEIDDAITVVNDLFDTKECNAWPYPTITYTNDSPYITTTDGDSTGLKYNPSSFTTGCINTEK